MRKKILGRTILGLFLFALLCAGVATDGAQSGMNIVGAPSKGFKVTGLNITGADVAAVVSTHLTAASCYNKPGGFYLVETDPEKLAAMKSEIGTSNSPGADPGTRMQNRYVPPNNFVSGGWSSNGTTLTVTLQLTDDQGRVLLDRSGSGPVADFSNISAKVTKDLTDAMCRVTAYKGTITFRVSAPVAGHSRQNTYAGKEDESATYMGTFRPDPYSPGYVYRIENGTGLAKIDDEYYEMSQGTSQRTAETGQNSATIPAGALQLILSPDGKSYSIEYRRIDFKMQYTIYEVNEPKTVWQEASELLWYAPAFTISGIPAPAKYDHLSGSRRIKVPVGLPIGESAPVEADVTWDFQPVLGTPLGAQHQ